MSVLRMQGKKGKRKGMMYLAALLLSPSVVSLSCTLGNAIQHSAASFSLYNFSTTALLKSFGIIKPHRGFLFVEKQLVKESFAT